MVCVVANPQAKRLYSSYGMHATQLMGRLIRQARLDKKITTQNLADRAAISRTTLQKIENGDLTVEVGLVFEVAFIVGLKLFDLDESGISKKINQIDDRLALMPKYARKPVKVIKDDF